MIRCQLLHLPLLFISLIIFTVLSHGNAQLAGDPMGSEYESGTVEASENAATAKLAILEDRAALGDEEAIFELGISYLFKLHGKRDFGRSLKWLQHEKLLGNTTAHFFLGFMHEHGFGTEPNEPMAILYYTFSSQGNNLNATMTLANRYYRGLGVEKDCTKALEHYKIIAQKAFAEFPYQPLKEEKRYKISEDDWQETPAAIAETVQYYQLLADNGNPQAAGMVGELHLHGLYGLERNYDMARRHLQFAVENNDPEAFARLGMMYLEGIGVPQNNELAYKYFTKGVHFGNSHSMNELGFMLQVGIGVEKNEVAAFELFLRSANLNNADGAVRAAMCYFNGHGTTRDYSLAFKYFLQAANDAHLSGFYYLGLMFEMGYGVAYSCEDATMYYKLVSERVSFLPDDKSLYEAVLREDYETSIIGYAIGATLGIEVYAHNLAYIYDLVITESIELPKAFNETNIGLSAIMLWYSCVAAGDSYAMIMLGDQLYSGASGLMDHQKAAYYYAYAAENFQLPRAYYSIGWMHQNGYGVDEDWELALRYYYLGVEKEDLACILAYIFLWSLAQFRMLNEFFSVMSIFSSSGEGHDDDLNSSVFLFSLLISSTFMGLFLWISILRPLILNQNNQNTNQNIHQNLNHNHQEYQNNNNHNMNHVEDDQDVD